MKILIGSTEICGWVSLFKETLINAGHECYSVVDERNRFSYKDNYDIVVDDHLIKHTSENKFVKKITFEINKIISRVIMRKIVYKVAKKVDVVIFFWRSFYKDSSDIEVLHKAGVKIIFYFVGSDVRDMNDFIKNYNITEWTFPSYILDNSNRQEKINYIKEAEKYASAIFSVPDQSSLQSRPFYHLQIPIDISKFAFLKRDRPIPKVVHIPSDPWKKGTDIIEKTIQELQDEGVLFNYSTLQNIPNDQVLEELMNADVLVDEIVFHGPGVLALEAMASGCVVATKYLDDSPPCFKPPVWNINAQNIKDRLKILFTNQDLRASLSIKSREYVISNNASDRVIKNALDKINYSNTEEYQIFRKTV